MPIVNRQDVKNFALRYSGSDSSLQELMDAALTHVLLKEDAFLTTATKDDIHSEKLRRKFARATHPQDWKIFRPDNGLDLIAKSVAGWLIDFLSMAGDDYAGEVKSTALKKLANQKTISNVLALTQNGPLLSGIEIEKLKKVRAIPKEERNGHVRFVSSLSEQCSLVQIITPLGMKYAARLAGNNCLNSNKHPDSTWPHRRRVKHPERWRYYSIRDPDNRSVLTISVDIQHKQIEYERNDFCNLTPTEQNLLNEALDKLKDEIPTLFEGAQPTSNYYGAHEP